MGAKLKLLLFRLGLLCLIYFISRGLFLAFNFQSYRQVPLAEIAMAFVVGLRFDIAAICRLNSPFIVLSLLPFEFVHRTAYRGFLTIFFLVANAPWLLLNVVDYEYHKFTGQRSTMSVLDMGADIANQIGQLSLHYWYLAAIGGLLIAVLYYFQPKPSPSPMPVTRKARDLIVIIVAVALTILGARGGWQRTPLNTGQAAINDKENLFQLALNSSFTMIHSQHKCDGMSKVRYFATDAEMGKQFPPKNPIEHGANQPLDNVVIVIVEGLSAEYTGIGNPRQGYTPFLDALAEKGLYFKNSFSDGRRSIDAPPSILAGLPHLRDETFYCTESKRLHGIGTHLKERGYNTSFFHGGKNGTMSFDIFSRRMGFDDYYGLNEYPKPQDSDGIWGIYDEPYLQYFAQQLSLRGQPFASVVFTLSTHNPYKVPAQYEGVFPEGKLPIHRTVAYFDHALKQFFAAAEKTPWYKNTLFVITGDHIGPSETISARMIDNYRVPIVLFHPGGRLPPVNRDRIVQHVDLGPSILDFLGIATDKILPFGHSIFDPSYEGLAVGQKDGNFWIADKNYYLESRHGAPSRLFSMAKLDAVITDKPEIAAGLATKLKAHIQWFINGLVENNLYR